MNIAEYLAHHADTRPSATAIRLSDGTSVSFSELKTKVCALSAHFKSSGLTPGDSVIIMMANSKEFVVAFWATLWCGAIVVPINNKLGASEVSNLIDQARPHLVLYNAPVKDTVKHSAIIANFPQEMLWDLTDIETNATSHLPKPEEREATDIAWVFFTSGTTGKPKGAQLSHKNLALMSESFCREVLPIGPGDLLLHAAPMSHGSGMYMIPYVAAGAGQLIPSSGKFKESEIVDLCARFSRVSFFAAPTMVLRLIRYCAEHPVRHTELLKGLRCIVYGGGPMLLQTAKQANGAFPGRLAQIYGQGECPMTISRLPAAEFQNKTGQVEQRLASVGQPFSSVDVKIDSDKQGEAGEILVRSELVMQGYLNDRESTDRTITEGWLHTGDIGRIDEDGYLYLTDRSKDVIISGGTNIYPREVEDVLIQHPAVFEVAVLGEPSAEWGEDVAAVVSLNTGYTLCPEELDTFCLDKLSRFKRPKHYYQMTDLPRNSAGKIDKREVANSLFG